ncbi:MAG: carbon-nitrogen hydrolase family protein [Spirochaetales bacterium]|jgi:predicted amidohydrolase|nr:carbon-nitrogen hydrolase family protein [Spirochaetales bacterium]
MEKLSLGLCQTRTAISKEDNLREAADSVRRAAKAGARLVCLPEMFSCPYENSFFVRYAEPAGGQTFEALSDMARKNGVYLIGGSAPEQGEGGAIYNTSYCFDPRGEPAARHRKIFLFDVDLGPGGFRFAESDTLKAGDEITLFDSPWGKIGVAICFDLRFPELFRAMACRGAVLAVLPGAFSMATGPEHWRLSLRMRAVDNQVFTAGISPARDRRGVYVSYAHSLICDPWGRVLGELGGRRGILLRELDITLVEKIRRELPLLRLFNDKKELF